MASMARRGPYCAQIIPIIVRWEIVISRSKAESDWRCASGWGVLSITGFEREGRGFRREGGPDDN